MLTKIIKKNATHERKRHRDRACDLGNHPAGPHSRWQFGPRNRNKMFDFWLNFVVLKQIFTIKWQKIEMILKFQIS